ncbi:MAG: bifunctional helix-turn-helix transcriptional regulator/GNAT family N-acetyltransferase [Sneathiella sp.]|nr:bifunctional helix-turn-helix transcriptional regulator/GNAT family N-acetyltransferase [Sneathiella sp.]
MDALKGFGELGLGSRLKRLSEHMMKETQLVYDHFNIDFDPYLFPIIKIIDHYDGITNTEIKEKLQLTQPAITQAVSKLVKKELVVVLNDDMDKRKKIIKISKKGKVTIQKMKPIWVAIDKVIKKYTLHSSNCLIGHINILEDKLKKNAMSNTIINHAKATIENDISIVAFDKKYSKDFYALNIEWLKAFFVVEPYDEEVLSKPDVYITSKGGHIFFAKLNDTIVGTVALMPTEAESIFELTKMAVSPKHRGLKIGQQLMQHCIDFAKENRFKGLMLYSNTKLANAI